ncbi:DUF333 domain-containing protein [Enterobacter hormaechei]|uniref:putative hemolysin n=1 Tax=Enterobacter hormaechei TaxID=158836 RepID=UPI003751491B
MKKALIAASVFLAAGCTSAQKQEQPLGMANPASVHCIKHGGKLDIVKESGGEVGYCTLPSGKRIEEWALFRRDDSK